MDRAPEIERRWIAEKIDPEILQWPDIRYVGFIRQGYQNESGSTRVRLIQGNVNEPPIAEFTAKTGFGEKRVEENTSLPFEAGLQMYNHAPYKICKHRYLLDGWEIDYFTEGLDDLVVVERELPHVGMPIALPTWLHQATEVTNTVSSSMLAVLSQDMLVGDPVRHQLEMAWLMRRLLSPSKRIVITGGPCSGKSTAIYALTEALPHAFHVVPEVATIVIGQINAPPFPASERLANRQFNRAMCGIQRHFEDMALLQALRDNTNALLIDRGVMDNAAYVTDGIQGLEHVRRTSRQLEFSRYDAVVYIDMPSEQVFYRCKGGNASRQEKSYEEARRLSQTVLNCWREHPSLIVVPDAPTWGEKCESVVRAVKSIVE